MSERLEIERVWHIRNRFEEMYLDREQARELYDALHAEFGDFDQARELSQLARESVAREMRLVELECEVQALRKRFTEPVNGTGMMRHEGKAKETDEEKVLRLWNRERTKWTGDTDARIVSRVRSHFKHLTNGDVYDLLRGQGVEVARPLTRDECAKSARAARHAPKPEPNEEQIERAVIKAMIRGRRPPKGYKIVNAEVWKASESLLSDADIREMAEGGLARAGLALESEVGGW